MTKATAGTSLDVIYAIESVWDGKKLQQAFKIEFATNCALSIPTIFSTKTEWSYVLPMTNSIEVDLAGQSNGGAAECGYTSSITTQAPGIKPNWIDSTQDALPSGPTKMIIDLA